MFDFIRHPPKIQELNFSVTPRLISTSSTYSCQLSRIIYRPHRPTRVFCAHFVLTHAHPRKPPGRSPIPNCSKSSTLNLEVLSRQASKKEDAPCWYGYSINSIKPWARTSPSQGPGYHIYRGDEAGQHYEAFPKFDQFKKTRYRFMKKEALESHVRNARQSDPRTSLYSAAMPPRLPISGKVISPQFS